MVFFDSHDVVEFSDGPVRTKPTFCAVVHGALLAQTFKVKSNGVILKILWLANINCINVYVVRGEMIGFHTNIPCSTRATTLTPTSERVNQKQSWQNRAGCFAVMLAVFS